MQDSDEFIERTNGFKPELVKPPSCTRYTPPSDMSNVVDGVDWRNEGFVTSVKQQVALIYLYCLIMNNANDVELSITLISTE